MIKVNTQKKDCLQIKLIKNEFYFMNYIFVVDFLFK